MTNKVKVFVCAVVIGGSLLTACQAAPSPRSSSTSTTVSSSSDPSFPSPSSPLRTSGGCVAGNPPEISAARLQGPLHWNSVHTTQRNLEPASGIIYSHDDYLQNVGDKSLVITRIQVVGQPGIPNVRILKAYVQPPDFDPEASGANTVTGKGLPGAIGYTVPPQSSSPDGSTPLLIMQLGLQHCDTWDYAYNFGFLVYYRVVGTGQQFVAEFLARYVFCVEGRVAETDCLGIKTN